MAHKDKRWNKGNEEPAETPHLEGYAVEMDEDGYFRPVKCEKQQKARDLTILGKTYFQKIENAKTGLNNERTHEGVPTFDKAAGEYVYPENPSPSNAWIVIGRDRPNASPSGYGGAGATRCGAIDLVVGRMSAEPKPNVFVNPNFESDAARIYISQKTDVDANFGLKTGYVGLSKNKSGIALKADSIRIMSRQGIKLTTLPPNTEPSSTGCTMSSIYGIELNAGNLDGSYGVKGAPFKRINYLQPIPKGENLTEALDVLSRHLEDLMTRLDSFVTHQMSFNQAISQHTHIASPGGGPTSPDFFLLGKHMEKTIKNYVDVKAKDWPQRLNLSGWRSTFLTEKGAYYICSRMNRTT
tara:strand:+ start:2058 stop:3119 length:1062 start_codon:yes stop_codon:yes gene_type:complete